MIIVGKCLDTIAHRGLRRNESGRCIAVRLSTREGEMVARARIYILCLYWYQLTKHTTFPAPHPHFL